MACYYITVVISARIHLVLVRFIMRVVIAFGRLGTNTNTNTNPPPGVKFQIMPNIKLNIMLIMSLI